jgi:hypothetical protein
VRHEIIEGNVGKLSTKYTSYRTRHKIITKVNICRTNIFGNLCRIHLRHLHRVDNILYHLFKKTPKCAHH